MLKICGGKVNRVNRKKKTTVDTCWNNLFKYFIQRQDSIIENGEFNKSFSPQK